MNPASKLISSAIHRNLVFVHGKGGVGKTAISQAVALSLSNKGKRTLWITLEDPTLPLGELRQMGPFLWHLNCDFTQAFEEYAALKIGVSQLTRIFLKNKVIRYLANAAPGVHELVLLGKIWFERAHYNHVVIDMPSTGYGLALFQSTENFSKLFRGGPLHRDAEAMLGTFKDPKQTGHLIVSLPEEMPLRESLELNEFLVRIFPENRAAFLVNRVFPRPKTLNLDLESSPQNWPSPFATTIEDYAFKRAQLENHNLRLWRDQSIDFAEVGFIPPELGNSSQVLSAQISEQLKSRAYV